MFIFNLMSPLLNPHIFQTFALYFVFVLNLKSQSNPVDHIIIRGLNDVPSEPHMTSYKCFTG